MPSLRNTSSAIRHVLASSLALSIGLLQAILYEVTDNMIHSGRYLLWNALLWSSFLMNLMAIPLMQIHMLVPNQIRKTESGSIIIGVLWLASLILFWTLGNIKTSISGDSSTLLEKIMSRTGIFGTAVISSLSGFAAANALFSFFFELKEVSYDSIRDKEQQLVQLHNDIESLKARINGTKDDPNRPSSGIGGLFSRLGSTLMSSNMDNLIMDLAAKEEDAIKLRREIDGLEIISNKQKNQTPFSILLEKAFVVYCAGRLLLAIYASVFYAANGSDPVTTVVSILLRLRSDSDLGAWTQLISLLFAGVLVMSSVRAILPILSRVLVCLCHQALIFLVS